jgi:hypothetical protein
MSTPAPGLAASSPLPKPSQAAASASFTSDEQVAFEEAGQALQQFSAVRLETPLDADLNTWAQAAGNVLRSQAAFKQ